MPTQFHLDYIIYFRIQAQREMENEGNIYPPFMVLEYGQITSENISSNEAFPVTFTVEFFMENDILHYVDVRFRMYSLN